MSDSVNATATANGNVNVDVNASQPFQPARPPCQHSQDHAKGTATRRNTRMDMNSNMNLQKNDSNIPRLRPELFEELKRCLDSQPPPQTHDETQKQTPPEAPAEIYQHGDESFGIHASVFNGMIVSQATCLVRPRNARQVSRLVIFCHKHGIDLSVKSGGFGTHGWSVAGQIIIDLSLLSSIAINLPDSEAHPLPSLKEYRFGESISGSTYSNANTLGKNNAQLKEMDGVHAHAQTHGKGSRRGNQQDDTFRGMMDRCGDLLTSGPSQKRDADEASLEEDESQPAQHSILRARTSTLSTKSTGTVEGSRPRNITSAQTEGAPVLDEQQKKSMMDGLGASLSDNSWNGGAGYSATASGLGISPDGSDALNPAFSADTPFSLASGYGLSSQRWSFGGVSHNNTNPTTSSSGRPTQSSSTDSSSDSTELPPPKYTVVSFGAGSTSKEIDKFTSASKYGPYHIPMSAFPVGPTIMMTGGFGFLGREYGLSMDNLIEIEIVLADGRIVWLGSRDEAGNGQCLAVENPDGRVGTMDAKEAEDLWWAVRGAGTTLGVATHYRAKAYYVPIVFSGNIIYPFNPLTAPSLIRHVRDCTKGSPRAMYANMILTAGPSMMLGVVIIQVCFSGARQKGAELMEAISSWQEERCLFKDIEERSFLQQQDSVANVLKGGAGRKWFIKSDLLTSLTDDVVWKTCQRFHTVPDGCTWIFEFTGGAVADTKTTCLPQEHREATYTVAALHQWALDVPDEDTNCVRTAQDWIENVIHPQSPGGPFPCFLQTSNLEVVRGTYGSNFDKLATIKNRFDPDNFFKHSLWPSTEPEEIGKQSGFSIPLRSGSPRQSAYTQQV